VIEFFERLKYVDEKIGSNKIGSNKINRNCYKNDYMDVNNVCVISDRWRHTDLHII